MRITLPLIILLLFSSGLNGQPAESAEDSTMARDTAQSDSFFQNSYIGLSTGTQLLFSRDVENLSFGDRFTSAFSCRAGTWFSPFWGAGVRLQGAALNGFSTPEGIYTAATGGSTLFEEDPVRSEVTINPDGTYRHFIRYANLSLHVFASMMHLLAPEKDHLKFDLIPSAGIGNMHVFPFRGVPGNNVLSANFGLTGKYRLNADFDFTVDARTALFPNEFEGRIAGSAANECYVSGSVGIVYYFHPRQNRDGDKNE